MRKQRIGLTLVEMIMVAVFLGILSAIAIPRINSASITKKSVETTAKKVVAALRRTRSLAILNAASNSQGYAMSISYSVALAPSSGGL
jgi:Tfp pilus assembly protein FimT